MIVSWSAMSPHPCALGDSVLSPYESTPKPGPVIPRENTAHQGDCARRGHDHYAHALTKPEPSHILAGAGTGGHGLGT